MTPHEQALLERFLAEMVSARAGAKDRDAETLIRDAVSRQPDAAYLLVQRAIQLDQALQLRESEIATLRAELERAASGRSGGAGFLGNDQYAWGRGGSAPVAAQSPPPQGSMPIPGVQAQGVGAPPAPQQPARTAPWGGSGMLGTVASTAAGVVAGSFLFQGIQNLLHRDEPQGGADHVAAGEHPSHSLLGDGSGFDNLVPDDDELADDTFASGDDGGDYT
jgi:hypothetical protein